VHKVTLSIWFPPAAVFFRTSQPSQHLKRVVRLVYFMPTVHIPAKPTNDNEHLELIARILFIIGFKYSIVEARWPQIKAAFHDFDIRWVRDAKVEDLVKAEGMIKNKAKIQRIIDNANECENLVHEYGGMAQWVAEVSARQHTDPMNQPSLEEECKRRFKGIGETTKVWVAYVFHEGKDEPEVKEIE